MIILSKIFGSSSFNSTINSIRPIKRNLMLFKSKLLKSNLLNSKLFTNSKLFVIFFASGVIVSVLLTNIAWAYKPGTFPGVGSYDKWQEGVAVFEQAYNIKNNAEAIKLYQKAIDIYPYDADFWLNLGNLYVDKQKRIECYLQAAKLNPDECFGYQGAGYEYQLLGDYNKAIELDKKGLSIDPSCSKIYVNLSDCLTKLKKYEEAINWLKKGYSITNNPDLLYDIGVTYLDFGNYKLAKVYLEKCRIYKPNDKLLIDALKEVNKKLNLK